MSLLFTMIEDAERQVRALRETNLCEPEHIHPLIEWLKEREENEDLIRSSRLAEAFCEINPTVCSRSLVYPTRTLRETLEALSAGKDKSQDVFDFTLNVLSAWSDIQCAHA